MDKLKEKLNNVRKEKEDTKLMTIKIKEDTELLQEKGENNENKVGIKDINDINKLIDLYHTTMSRGKKQRIKKKLKNLGYNKDIPPVEINQNINIKKENNNKINSNDDYVKIKISNNRTELNKKMKNKIKQNKKEEHKNNKNFINKKRERDNKGFGEDENIQRKKKKKENKELNITKNIINERMDYINKNKSKKQF